MKDIQQAHEAIVTGRPHKLNRFDGNVEGHQNDVNRLQRRYIGIHSNLEEASARVSQLLESKQSAVHSQLSVTISTAAVAVSALTLLVNLFFG